MPIDFQTSAIESFFGGAFIAQDEQAPFGNMHWIDYQGPTLKYSLIIDSDRDAVLISGDKDRPWGGESMYEIGVPCTTILAHPTGIGSGLALLFYYGDPSDSRNRTLTIMKRTDLDLVVWPSWRYPDGHPNAYPADEPV